MIKFKTVAAAAVSVCAIGIASASAQQEDLRECLRRLESAVSEGQSLLRQIDERSLNRSDADFVGGYKNTRTRRDVDQNLEVCEDATANYEHWNEKLRDIAAESATNQGAYQQCVDELRDVVARYNRCRVAQAGGRLYGGGIDECVEVLAELKGWLRDAEAQGRCN